MTEPLPLLIESSIEIAWDYLNRTGELGDAMVAGRFLIDLEPAADGVTPGRVIELRPREGIVVPRGVVHRTRAPERSIILMVETASIVPTGD